MYHQEVSEDAHTALCGRPRRDQGDEGVSCHCECQNLTYRFEIDYNFNGTAHVRDVACRGALLHVRSLDPGVQPQEYHDMMHHFEVDFRNVTYIADVMDVEAIEGVFTQETPG